MASKKQTLSATLAVAKGLGRAPTKAEFASRSKISAYFLLRRFRTWTEAVRAAGLRSYTRGTRESRAEQCRKTGGMAVRRNREDCQAHLSAARNLQIRALWRSGSEAGRRCRRRFASLRKASGNGLTLWHCCRRVSRKEEIQRENAEGKEHRVSGEAEARVGGSSTTDGISSRRDAVHAVLKGRPTCGNAIEFRGLQHEPVSEQGVVLVFGILAEELATKSRAFERDLRIAKRSGTWDKDAGSA